MTDLSRKILGVALEIIKGALEEIDGQASPPVVAVPLTARKRRKRRIAVVERKQLGAPSAPPSPRQADPSGRVVVVAVDEKPPTLALVVDENPRPGFKTIRFKDGRSKGKFSKVEHRVIDAEVLRDATADEREHGLKSAS